MDINLFDLLSGINGNILASFNPQPRLLGEEPICCSDASVTECRSLSVDHKALGKISLTLPDNITVEFCNLVGNDPGCFHYNSSEASCILTFNRKNKGIHGHCQVLTTGQSFSIENCGAHGHFWKEFNVKALGHSDVALDNETNLVLNPGQQTLLFNEALNSTAVVVYSVKVYYTKLFAAATSDIPGFITQLLAETNQGYVNSLVPIRVKLHGMEEATISEVLDPYALLAAFETMKGSVEAVRGCADSALLLVTKMSSCGVSYFNTIQTGKTLSASRKDCAQGGFSFGHELAHNFGCHHDPAQYNNQFYPYGHGHLINQGTGNMGYRSLMAFRAPGFETRVNYYSNPDVLYPGTNTPTGVIGLSNNARVITENRMRMAAIGNESSICLFQGDSNFTVSVSNSNLTVSTTSTASKTTPSTPSTTSKTTLSTPSTTSETTPSTPSTTSKTTLSTPTTTSKTTLSTPSTVSKSTSKTTHISISNPASCSIMNGLPTLISLLQNGFTKPDSANDCHETCEGRRHCNYWTYNNWSQQCFIWAFCYDYNRHNKGWRSGPKACGVLPTLPCEKSGARISLTYKSKERTNRDECIKDCQFDDSCEYWAFMEDSSLGNVRCRLYSLIKPFLGWTSGLYTC